MGLFDWSEEKVEKVYQEGAAAFEAENYAAALKLLTKAAERGHLRAQNLLGRMYDEGRGIPADKAEALRWYLKAAEQGYDAAQYKCAVCYKEGRGTAADPAKAFYWFGRAAGRGRADAQNQLGLCYGNGQGTEKDYEKALYWFEKAAQQGYSGAQYNCGGFYQRGLGVEADEDIALDWYQKAAEQGYENAKKQIDEIQARRAVREEARPYLERGMTALKEEQYQDALPDLRKAAELGGAEAQYQYAEVYLQGLGVEKDRKEAVGWLVKAYQQGHKQARIACGSFYAQIGLAAYNAEDYQKAFPLLEKAAMLGNAEAQNRLGLCYGNGKGTEKDEDKAFAWYQKAAAQGHEKAKKEAEEIQSRRKSNICFKRGMAAFNNKQYDAAEPLLKEAAEAGHVEAQYRLALLYYTISIETGLRVGYDWLQKAAENGHIEAKERLKSHDAIMDKAAAKCTLSVYEKVAQEGEAEAQFQCGMMYYKGMGTEINKGRALFWFEKAAGQGNAEAQFNCGMMYYKGEGTTINKAKAFYWVKKAAEQGQADAQLNCGIMYAVGEGTESRNLSEARYWLQKAAQSDDKKAAAKARETLREL